MSRFPVSDHCDGSRFFTPGSPPVPGLLSVLRWRLTRRVPPWDAHAVVPQPMPRAPAPGSPVVTVTWVNHATFLLRFDGLTLLTDPVFGKRIGLFGLIGPERVHVPGIGFDDLPRIDVILLSHDHYDHCDLPTLTRLARRDDPLVVTPLGYRPLLRRAGLARVVELDWWQSHALDLPLSPARPADCEDSTTTLASATASASTSASFSDSTSASSRDTPDRRLTLTLTPAQHWSNRLRGARCGRLWGGFHLASDVRRIFFAGDTGYHSAFFKDIRSRLGAPDLALLPIGAYEPRWFMRGQHVNPADAVQIHRDLEARLSLGMHWGTFQLTDEPRLAPPTELRQALAAAGLPPDSFRVVEPGQSLHV
jgi:L-ascorbate metabolism protein UlaG (beta-lactamase superfamily)